MSLTFHGLGVRIWIAPDDFVVTADFYGGTLGLTCVWRSDEQGIATYDLGFGPTLVVERFEPGPGHEGMFGRPTGVCLHVSDVNATYATMAARGVPFDGPPTTQPWGAMMAFFKDPAGNEHALLQLPG